MRHRSSQLLSSILFLSLITTAVSAQTLTLSVDPVFQPNPVVLLPGGQLNTHILLDTPDPVQGWSYGICHDPSLVIDGFADGSTTVAMNDGDGPDFNEVAAFPDGISVGVVISIVGASTLSPGVDYQLQTIDYSLDPSVVQPPAGDPDLEAMIIACDTVGAPPVVTVIVVGGGSIVPALEATFVVIPAEAECELLCSGGVDFVDLTWNDCNPGGPADYYLLFRDSEQVALFDNATQSFSDTGLAPGSYHYELISVTFPTPTSSPSILQGSCDVDVIPVTLMEITPTEGVFLGGTPMTVTGTGFLAALDTTVSFGGVPALDVLVVDDTTITCTTPPSDFLGDVSICLTSSLGSDTGGPFTYGFVRGMIGPNTDIDVEDPIFAISWLFGGGPAPDCPATVDVNDDNSINIADPIFLIEYLFNGGTTPPEPFAVPGLDPTDPAATPCLSGVPPVGCP